LNKKRTQAEVDSLTNEIRRYLTIGTSYPEIINHLKIPSSTFYYYLNKIAKEDKKALKHLKNKMLDHETIVCKNRLESTLYKCEQIFADTNSTAKERIEAVRLKSQITIDILRIIRDSDIDGESDRKIQQTNSKQNEEQTKEFFNSIS
jgi:hypothetical protein